MTVVSCAFDRGHSWLQVELPPGPFQYGGLSFVDDQHWWVSNANILSKTSDAGQTWQQVRTVDPDVSGDWTFQPAQVIDARHAWLIMSTPLARGLAMSSDGGMHWTPVTVPQPA